MSAERLPIEYPEEHVYPISELGEGLVLRNRRTVELTPKFAADFLEYAEFYVGDAKVDRHLDERHVIYLTREMVGGSFLWEHVNLVICTLDGREHRLNGQHTCWSRLYAEEQGLDKETRCPVQVLKYEAKNLDDMRRLYASLDAAKPRSETDKISALLSGTDGFIGYKKSYLTLLAHAVALWQWESMNTRTLHKASERAYLMLKDFHKVAQLCGSFIRESKPSEFKHMKRAPVMAAFMATADKAPQIAMEFWRNVRDGIGLNDKEDPQYVLRQYLFSTTLASSSSSGKDAKKISGEEMYRACIHGWNAYRAGRHMKQIRVSLTEQRPQPK